MKQSIMLMLSVVEALLFMLAIQLTMHGHDLIGFAVVSVTGLGMYGEGWYNGNADADQESAMK